MSDIQPYNPGATPLSTEVQTPMPGGVQDAPGVSLGGVFRRRWKMILAIWLVIAGVGVTFSWLKVAPTVTATAVIEVEPQLNAILFNDSDSRAMPFYSEFLLTQAKKIAGSTVLTAALQDPEVQSLPDDQASKSFSALQKSVEVTNEPRTHLLLVEVTQPTRGSAVTICDAIVRAYMRTLASSEDVQMQTLLDVLNKELLQLQDELAGIQMKIDQLIADNKLPEGSVLDAFTEVRVQASVETRQTLEAANLAVIELKLKLDGLKAGDTTMLTSGDPNDLARQEHISAAPTVRALETQLADVSSRLLKLTDGLTEEHPMVTKAKREQSELQNRLTEERKLMGEEFDKSRTVLSEDELELAIQRTEAELAKAEKRQQALLERVQESDEETLKLSREQRRIAELVELREMKRQQLELVSERIRARTIESQRPTRVRLESEAAVLASGYRDKRTKYTLAAVLGGAFFAFFAAMLRDRVDPHLRGPQQIETHMGLRVLGAVPCLSELKSGHVTHEDFVESYRVVRATLSSLGPSGSPPQCLLVTSAQCAEGKTSLAISLSASLAETGARVLLVDADLQAPSIHHFFRIKHPIGLESVLAGEAELLEAIVPAPVQGVDALCAGANGDPTRGALDWRSAQKLISCARQTYDYVVIDSPPALGAADALVWSRVVHGVVISSLAGSSDTSAMQLACQRLRTVGANLLGAVVGNVSINETYYSHSVNSSQGIRRGWDSSHQSLPALYDTQLGSADARASHES